MELYPVFPDDLSALDDDALAALIEDAQTAVEGVASGSIDTGDLSAADVIAQTEAAVDAIERARGEQTARADEIAASQAALADLAARARGEQPAADEPAAEEAEPAAADEPAAEEEPALAAAATPEPQRRSARFAALPRRSDDRAPTDDTAARPRIQVVSEGVGRAIGTEMPSMRDVAAALLAKRRAFSAVPEGVSEDVPVVRVLGAYPSDRILGDDPVRNWEQVNAVIGEEALVASGGLCAPVQPYYDLDLVSEAMRPVRDALPSFNATRGGIRFMTPPKLSAVTTAIGYITAAQDLAGGTSATKTSQTIPCPAQTEVDVAIIYRQLKFGNLGARTFPEQVENFLGLAQAAWARLAETKIIDGIAAASTATTAGAVAGAASTLAGQIITAAAGMRSRHRMSRNRTLRVLIPDWAVDLLDVDLARAQFDRLEHRSSDVLSLLRDKNIVVSTFVDGETSSTQVFGTQAASALLGFPSTVIWYIFPEGSFVYLDGGTLDLGVVRDSTLNTTNDFSIFAEGFENVAFLGVESLKVTSTVTANGSVMGPTTATSPVV